MRIVFKVIAIFGLLSFLGGLMNGVIFFLGLILMVVFGYFGWRPESTESTHTEVPKKNPVSTSPNRVQEEKMQMTQTSKSTAKDDSIDIEVWRRTNPRKSINEFYAYQNGGNNKIQNSNIANLGRKLNILKESHRAGLIGNDEYESKLNEIQLKIDKEHQNLNQLAEKQKEEEINQKIFKIVQPSINQLDALLSEGLLNDVEYSKKKNDILQKARKEFDSDMKLRDPSTFKVKLDPSSKKYGYANQTGEIVIEHRFDDAFPFSEGLARVVVENKSGYIDKSGSFAILPIFDPQKSSFFKDGVATVALNGRDYRINTKGQEIN